MSNKAQSLRDKPEMELRERLAELRKDLFQTGFRAGRDETEERGKKIKLRRDIARILTILRERELGIERKVVSGGGGE